MRGLLLRGMTGGRCGFCGGRVVGVVEVLVGWLVVGCRWMMALVARVVLRLGLVGVGLEVRLEAGLSECD